MWLIFISPYGIAHWWDPSGVPVAACEIDLRPNGAFRWVHGGPGGERYVFAGAYREIAPPEKLVFSVRMFPSSPETIGTLIFIVPKHSITTKNISAGKSA